MAIALRPQICDVTSPYVLLQTASSVSLPPVVLRQVGSSYRGAVSSSAPCVHEGHLKTDRNWFGYLANITIIGSGRLTFEFIYPVDRCCQNVLFYRQDQLAIMGTSRRTSIYTGQLKTQDWTTIWTTQNDVIRTKVSLMPQR